MQINNCLFIIAISTEIGRIMEEEIKQKSNTEIEERIQVLSSREETLRKDYEKCITWRVRV